jgi:hypothetical protein
VRNLEVGPQHREPHMVRGRRHGDVRHGECMTSPRGCQWAQLSDRDLLGTGLTFEEPRDDPAAHGGAIALLMAAANMRSILSLARGVPPDPPGAYRVSPFGAESAVETKESLAVFSLAMTIAELVECGHIGSVAPTGACDKWVKPHTPPQGACARGSGGTSSRPSSFSLRGCGSPPESCAAFYSPGGSGPD